MNKIIIGIIILVLLVGIGVIISSNKASSPTSPSVSVPQSQNTVTLTSSGFSPAVLTIKTGDKVTWVNKSGTSAVVNSSPHPTHTDFPPLNLGNFSDGRMLTLAFDKPGTYKYHNHLNPSQFGSIIVQ